MADHISPPWRAPLMRLLVDVAAAYNTTSQHLRGPQRQKTLVEARAEFCRRAYATGKWSSTQIGIAINRDHTSVLYLAGLTAGSPWARQK